MNFEMMYVILNNFDYYLSIVTMSVVLLSVLLFFQKPDSMGL